VFRLLTSFPGAVDLDVYGAFQICAIGALARPPRLTGKTGLSAAGNNVSFVMNAIMPVGECSVRRIIELTLTL
jgi:hypothetical protein